MWYLIIERPDRTHPPGRGATGVASAEDPFLDFDPILPGWPPPQPPPQPPPPGKCGTRESLASFQEMKGRR